MFRAAGVRPSRPLAQTVSVITALFSGIRLRPEPALPATDCAGGSVLGFAINVLLLLDRG